jgi:BASS family bile acid:Na+ symporter
VIEKIIFLFPVWILSFSLAGFYFPFLIQWFQSSLITPSLGLIMLGMGLTMSVKDFSLAIKTPKIIFIGVLLQYTIMPLLGFSLATIFQLSPSLSVGLILVSCCPGGTASNVLTYIARGNVAISICLTSISTLLAVFTTPSLTLLLAGKYVDVNAFGLFKSTLEVIILPILIGVTINHFFPKFSKTVSTVSPLLAILLIILIVASVLSSNRVKIYESGFKLIGLVFLFHSLGFLFGYLFSKIFKYDEILSRTISIEVGMQNSGLGVVLAKANFSDPLVMVPSALSSLSHSLIASLLAWIWRRK